MLNRRQSSWIHRFSRPLLGAFAAVGIADTGYLTSVKLAGNGVACSSESCNQVLSSPYANVFGLPLTLFGLLAYLAVGVLAIAPLVIPATNNKKFQNQLQDLSWLGLFLIGTAMAVFSGYLMYLLAFVIQAACPYCIVSAICSLAIFGLTLVGREWDDLGQLLFRGLAVAALTVVMTIGIYSQVGGAVSPDALTSNEITTLEPQGPATKGVGWTITSGSGEAEIALAQHLKKLDATMYGGFFCSHCYHQKQLFGRTAFKKLVNYVECHPQGNNPQLARCEKAGITGFPTWEIQGKQYSGTQSLEKLAEISGYQGPQNFRYSKLMPGSGKK
jgi:uncharacterized membrane protein